MAPTQKPKKRPQHFPTPPLSGPDAAERSLRTIRDELQGTPADLERTASYLPPGHPHATELRDLAGTVRTVRMAVARIAIWLEEARRADEARHG